jgi:anti-sigma-K factor RskA
MTDNRDNPSDAALAAEYASGALTGADLVQARAREAADPAFARDVARWRGRLAGLHDEVDPVAPPAGLWARIERAAGGKAAANDNDMHKAVRLWRAATAGMTAVAAGLALALMLQNVPTQPAAQPPATTTAATPMVALVGDKQATQVMVSWDPASRQMVLAVTGGLPNDGKHSHELWVIPPGGTPRSLGTMALDKQSHKRLAETLASLLQHGATIAISVEPRGGSPTGAPTGPVIASGSLTSA